MEDWAEIRRLHKAEGMPIKAVARHLGVGRNTVRRALAADAPPRYSRPAKGSLVDAYEPAIRDLLRQFPMMPATVIAERIGWPHGMTTLKDRVRQVRPEYRGVDPADRVTYEPGDTVQCDLWFPEPRIPTGFGQQAMLPVLVMVAMHSKLMRARMLPTRTAADLTAGMWTLLAEGFGAVPKRLWWDRESAIATSRGKPTAEMAGFCGTLATRAVIAPGADPEFKGGVERHNHYLETSFLPGRSFDSPEDFNGQLDWWLRERADRRTVRVTGRRPGELFTEERTSMLTLPPVAPVTGWFAQVRLPRDYYVRLDSNDYSVDPHMIGRMVEVRADLEQVWVTCAGVEVARHRRCWAIHRTITDPAHQRAAKTLREHYRTTTGARPDLEPVGWPDNVVPIRSLDHYDDLFGADDGDGGVA